MRPSQQVASVTRQISLSPGKPLQATGGPFPGNKIKTSRYTPATFLPLNLFEQLHKFGNLYFFLISGLMWLGEKTPLFVGTIKYASTLATLLAMMSVTALMAFLDDRRRDAADLETNGQKAHAVAGGESSARNKTWENVQVGDLLVVEQEEEFPADLVPLYCSGPEGSCYVSTANLDGETNLKPKSAPPAAQMALTAQGQDQKAVLNTLGGLSLAVDAEPPKASIHDFEGRLQLTGAAQGDEALGPKNLLLRGTTLRNTAWCVGVVVYTGTQTRMVMNSREAPMKRSNIERVTNQVMVVVLAAQAFLALATDVLFLFERDTYASYWYIQMPDIILPEWFGYWLTFFVLYSNLMPISLYPTLEVCNAAQSYFIKNDAKMYYKEEDSDFKMSAGAKSSGLSQELGQVNYIFSDKTGTLTRNIMEVKRLLIAGRTFGTLRDGEKGFNGTADMDKARAEGLAGPIDAFLEVLAVAHTVMVSKGADGRKKFEAESPDESALVEATANIGWEFTGASGQTRTVQVKGQSGEQTYTVLAVNQFDSTRKRMSVVVKHNEDYILMCKGADNVMLDPNRASDVPPNFEQCLSEFAQEGLRTLVIARKQLQAAEVEAWVKRQQDAERQLGDREKALAAVAEEIEVGMQVVGATAIEDKLQDKVPQTIENMRTAGIKIWVLTGDKLETARNIGFSSKVLTDEMYIATLDRSKEAGEVRRDLVKFKDTFTEKAKDKVKVALMVTGAALEEVQAEPALQRQFLDMATMCSIVIACRVSPLQKAQMVRMVRQGVKPTPVTLAVGDGANDVPMIQEAQVGIGIAGREGRQAMNNSDFSIAQFQYLQRLLFVHGRWNYRRVCKFTLFTFWRNAVQVLMIFYYTFISGFSGTSLFEDWIRLSFNFLCSFPIMATGCFDQDIDEQTALENPQLYAFGREGRDLNAKKIGITLVSALMHSVILEIVTMFAFPHMDLKGVGDYYAFGTAVYSCLLVAMNYRVAFLNYTHNKYTVGSIFLSFVLYVLFLIVYPCCKFIADLLAPNMYMVPLKLAEVPIFWVCIVVVPVIAMTADMLLHTLQEQTDELLRTVSEKRAKAAWSKAAPSGSPAPGRPEVAPLLGDNNGLDAESSGLDLSPLAQQQTPPLWAEHWVMDVRVLGLILSVFIFLIGLFSFYTSHANNQIRIHYEGSGFWADPWGTDMDKEVKKVQENCSLAVGGQTKTCQFEVDVPEDMSPPILLYYALGPFYQNHNNYLKSEVIKELMGQEGLTAAREQQCSEETRVDSEGKDIVPCGMKATSVFNDTFSIKDLKIHTSGIAWDSDIERYHNPPDYGTGDTSWLGERYPMFKKEGVKNEQFAVWMRPSALWRVWNPYGYINEVLNKGDKLVVTINSNYPVESLNGYKQLVLTTTGWMGGRDDSFGDLLIALGLILVVFWGALGAFMSFHRAGAGPDPKREMAMQPASSKKTESQASAERDAEVDALLKELESLNDLLVPE